MTTIQTTVQTTVPRSTTPDAVPPDSRISALRALITDAHCDVPDRLIRLQGWRGDDAAQARHVGAALRLAPAVCSVLAFTVAVTGSLPVVVAALASAVVGVFAANHPVETVYNAVARATGRTAIPTNRASKRLGCLIGTVFFTAVGVGLAAGNHAVATALAAIMGSVAAFVALTNICVPSILFILLRGVHRATARSLFAR